MGKSQRRKGMAFQRFLANRWKELGYFPLAYSTGAGQSRHNRHSEVKLPDVENTDPLWVECKADENISPWRALVQAEEDAPEGRLPVAVCKKNRKGVLVAMRLEDWEELLAGFQAAMRLAYEKMEAEEDGD